MGSASRHVACAALQGWRLAQCSAVIILAFLLSLQQEALHLYFALGPAHYVANPVMLNRKFFLFRIITDISKNYHVLFRKHIFLPNIL